MYTTINKDELVKTLGLINRVSTKQTTLPVLQCVLLECVDGQLNFKVTNLEIGVETKIKADTETSGTLAVPTNTLLQTVLSSPDREIVLRGDRKTLIVEWGKSSSGIKTMAFDDFPHLPDISDGGDGQVIKGDLFALGIKTVAFATAVSSIKPELGSVYVLQKKEHTLTFVATDSFRLMEKTIPQKGVVLSEPILIPQKNALEIAKLCEAIEEDPVLRVNENLCTLSFSSGTNVTSRLTNSSFPDYNAIIPKEYVAHSVVLKADFAGALKKAGIFINKFSQTTLDVSEQTITISATNDEVGTTTDSISATNEGEEVKLNFNQNYLNDPLNHINDDSLAIHLAGVARPLVMEGVSDKTLRYLVMPMNR